MHMYMYKLTQKHVLRILVHSRIAIKNKSPIPAVVLRKLPFHNLIYQFLWNLYMNRARINLRSISIIGIFILLHLLHYLLPNCVNFLFNLFE